MAEINSSSVFAAYLDRTVSEERFKQFKNTLKEGLKSGDELNSEEIKKAKSDFATGFKSEPGNESATDEQINTAFNKKLNDIFGDSVGKKLQKSEINPVSVGLKFELNTEQIKITETTKDTTANNKTITPALKSNGIKLKTEEYDYASKEGTEITSNIPKAKKESGIKTVQAGAKSYFEFNNAEKKATLKLLQLEIGVKPDGFVGAHTLSTLLKKYDEATNKNDFETLKILDKLVGSEGIDLGKALKGTKLGETLEQKINNANLKLKEGPEGDKIIPKPQPKPKPDETIVKTEAENPNIVVTAGNAGIVENPKADIISNTEVKNETAGISPNKFKEEKVAQAKNALQIYKTGNPNIESFTKVLSEVKGSTIKDDKKQEILNEIGSLVQKEIKADVENRKPISNADKLLESINEKSKPELRAFKTAFQTMFSTNEEGKWKLKNPPDKKALTDFQESDSFKFLDADWQKAISGQTGIKLEQS